MTINAEQCAQLIAEIKNPQWEVRAYKMTTPLQSLVKTIAEYIHDEHAPKGDIVNQWQSWIDGESRQVIQYGIGPDDYHDAREFHILALTENQARDIERLVENAYRAGQRSR